MKKKLISFLTDESWAITKENLLKLSVAATSIGAMAILPDTNIANAGHTNNIGQWGHVSVGHISTWVAGHANLLVNWTYNISPTAWHLSRAAISYTALSHSSHADHGSHSSCGRGCW